jgi:hypothetical protein
VADRAQSFPIKGLSEVHHMPWGSIGRGQSDQDRQVQYKSPVGDFAPPIGRWRSKLRHTSVGERAIHAFQEANNLDATPWLAPAMRLSIRRKPRERQRGPNRFLGDWHFDGTGPSRLPERLGRPLRAGKRSIPRGAPSADRSEPTCAPAGSKRALPPSPAARVRPRAGADRSSRA